MDLPNGKWASNEVEWICEECPVCLRNYHLYFNVQKGRGLCHGCKSVVGSWKKLHDLFSGKINSTNLWKQSVKSIHETNVPLKTYVKEISDAASVFLSSRRVSEDKFAFDPRTKELIAQIDPWSPEYPVEYLRRRVELKKSKWIHYTNTKTSRYGFGLCDHHSSSVLYVEGLFDVLSPQLSGVAVAILGTVFREDMGLWALSKNIRKAAVWLDPDEAGIKGAYKACQILDSCGYDPIVFSPERLGRYRWEKVDAEPGDLEADHDLINKVRWILK